MASEINVTRAYEGNLKRLSLTIPKNKVVLFSGPTGSGKTTLLFDVIFKEMLRVLSPILGSKLNSDPVKLEGFSGAGFPVDARMDKAYQAQQTVGELAGLTAELVRLFSAEAKLVCVSCGAQVQSDPKILILNALLETEALVLAPVKNATKEKLLSLGFTRGEVLGEEILIEDECPGELKVWLDKWREAPSKLRVVELLESAQKLNGGVFEVRNSRGGETRFNLGNVCGECLEPVSVADFGALNKAALGARLDGLSLSEAMSAPIAKLPQIGRVAEFLINVGLGGLSLSRKLASLSSGELLRVRLAPKLASNSSGFCFFLDEPLSALHPIERDKLWGEFEKLAKQGNTVLISAGGSWAAKRAETVFHLGPGGGRRGGRLVEAPHQASLPKRDWTPGEFTELRDIEFRNLKIPKLSFPHQAVLVVTGGSGVGKSSLIEYFSERFASEFELVKLELGMRRSSGSGTVGSYLGAWTELRKLLSQTPEAKSRGLKSRDFSLRDSPWLCDACSGAEECSFCQGSGFTEKVSGISLKGFLVGELLRLSLEEVHKSFSWSKPLREISKRACELGVGYLKLRCSLGSLSQGELERVRLARLLQKKPSEALLYLFDEGLSRIDSVTLLKTFRSLVDAGASVVFTSHDASLIKNSDYLIELGSGPGGGCVAYSGIPR